MKSVDTVCHINMGLSQDDGPSKLTAPPSAYRSKNHFHRLVGGFSPTRLKNTLVKWDHVFQGSG